MFRLNNRIGVSICTVLCVLGMVALLPGGVARAYTPLNRIKVAKIVDEALPTLISSNNSELVRRMLDAQFGKPIAESFDPEQSLKTVFGNQTPTIDKDCQRETTGSGDESIGECVASLGKLAGSGSYTEFAWDRNLDLGNLRLLRRDPDGTLVPSQLPSVRMTDAQAYEQATKFLVGTMGIAPEEFTQTLPGARLLYPVRSLSVGENGPNGKGVVTPIMKLVKISRSVLIELPTPVDSKTGMRITAPGEAFVLLNDTGIAMARVKRWVALQKSPLVDPANAKNRTDLINEITDAIMENGAETIDAIRARLVINEPDPAMLGLQPAIMPGVEISVSAVPRDPSESDQARLGPTTAGNTQQFALVRLPETKAPSDD